MQTDFSGYFCLALSTVSVTAQDVTITIHLRGVYESKISLLPLTGVNALKPITEVQGVKNGSAADRKQKK